jgi:short subunit dehydrogenase-like uncharacterized protein
MVVFLLRFLIEYCFFFFAELVAKLTKEFSIFDNMPTVFVADASNQASLNEMCQRCKVVIDCVGPVRIPAL